MKEFFTKKRERREMNLLFALILVVGLLICVLTMRWNPSEYHYMKDYWLGFFTAFTGLCGLLSDNSEE